VLLTDDELEKLKAEYSDYEERIERLSSYVASTGKPYKSHYATIRNWARKDAEKPVRKEVVPSWIKKTPKNSFNSFSQQRDYDYGEIEKGLFENDP
jgi:cob(I)alamin adenosyltransferase